MLLASRTVNVPDSLVVGISTVRVRIQDQKGAARSLVLCHSLYHDERVVGIRSTAPSRTNTAIRFRGYSSDSGTRSLLRHSLRHGGSSSCMTFSLKGLVTFGEFVPSRLPLFASSRNPIPIHHTLGYFGTRQIKRSIYLGGGQVKMAQRLVDCFGNVSYVGNRLRVVCIAQVVLWENINPDPWRIWKLIPVRDEGPSRGLAIEKEEAPPEYPAK